MFFIPTDITEDNPFMSYNSEQNYKNKQKIKKLLKEMPQFLEVYFKDMQNMNMSSTSILGYARDLKMFFDWLQQNGFKNQNLRSSTAEILENLTIEDINEYFSETMDDKEFKDNKIKEYSANTKARRMASIRAMYRYFYERQLISNDLSNRLRSPKIHDKTILALEGSDITRILQSVLNTEGLSNLDLIRHNKVEKRDYAIIATLFSTGIRVSELIGLDVASLDFKKNTMKIIRKGGDEAEVSFPDITRNALIDYINTDRQQLLQEEESPALFVSTSKKRITVSAVEKLIKKYALKAGIANANKVTPHKARSSFATSLYNQSNDIQLVADSLGHKSMETTRKHYAKTSQEKLKKIAEYSANLLNNNDK